LLEEADASDEDQTGLSLAEEEALVHCPMHRRLVLAAPEEEAVSVLRNHRFPKLGSVLVPNRQPGLAGLEELGGEGALRGAGCPRS
jgi:hypothetical protein